LKKALLLLNIQGLVFESIETPTLDAFVATHNPHPRDLAACALQMAFQIKGRLAALLILYRLSDAMYAKVPVETRAEVYCRALQEDVLENEDAWGCLWMNGNVGLLGTHVLAQGEAAIPFLLELLDDESIRNRYELGNEKALRLSIRLYRLKDFAAYYIAKIKAYELPWEPLAAERDLLIAEMRRILNL
jgi:hypothetical protein